MRDILANLKNRGLTFIDKTQLLKTFIMSEVIYLLSNISLPTEFVKEIEKLMFTFMWNGPDKISKATMYADHSEKGTVIPKYSMYDKYSAGKMGSTIFLQIRSQLDYSFLEFLRLYGGKSILSVIIQLRNYQKSRISLYFMLLY